MYIMDKKNKGGSVVVISEAIQKGKKKGKRKASGIHTGGLERESG